MKQASGYIIPAIAFGVCIWGLAQSTHQAWLYLLAEIAVGGLIFFILKRVSNHTNR